MMKLSTGVAISEQEPTGDSRQTGVCGAQALPSDSRRAEHVIANKLHAQHDESRNSLVSHPKGRRTWKSPDCSEEQLLLRTILSQCIMMILLINRGSFCHGPHSLWSSHGVCSVPFAGTSITTT
jgi:hypothetical protein